MQVKPIKNNTTMQQRILFILFFTLSTLFAQKQKGYPVQELTVYYHKFTPSSTGSIVGATIFNMLLGPIFKPKPGTEEIILLGEPKAEVLRVLGEPSRRIKYSELEAEFASELLDWESLGIAFT